jgi:MFS family permease
MGGVLSLMMLGGTIPISLYVLWEQQMGFSELMITVIFAVYVVGTLFALLFLGDLSDHIGRKKVLFAAIILAAISTGVFLVAFNVALLLVARTLSGVAVGLATGTATAALAELHPRGDHKAAAVVAAGCNLTGLGLGPLLAGALAEYVLAPTLTVFWVYLGLLLLAGIALAAVPETVTGGDSAFNLKPNIGIPSDMRAVMAGAALGIFAAFSLLGLFSSLVPTFLGEVLGVGNLAVVGAVSFLIFIAGAISQAIAAKLANRKSVGSGLALLLLGLAALQSALILQTLWLFVIGTVASGVAIGFIFRGGLAEINRLVIADRRAEVVSAFFVAAYLGMSVPVVFIGLGSQVMSTITANLAVSGLVAAIAAGAILVVLRTFGTPALPPSTHPRLRTASVAPRRPSGRP